MLGRNKHFYSVRIIPSNTPTLHRDHLPSFNSSVKFLHTSRRNPPYWKKHAEDGSLQYLEYDSNCSIFG